MRPLARALPAALVLLAVLLVPRSAGAYTWMIRHGYTGCSTCHTDPSGGMGALTEYGRAQGDLLLRTRYGASSDEASRAAGLLWGAVALPESVRLGGDVRGALLAVRQPDGAIDTRALLMRADLYGDVKLGRFRAAASLGYAQTGALRAALTRGATDNLVSREHWVGVELDEEGAFLLRAGRIARPFGIRNVEHTLWVRSSTRSDVNDAQQHGVALAFDKAWIRGEVMALLGNYQVRPDDYRERGYSAYVELAPSTRLALGLSSMFTRARRDLSFRVTNYRHAHGVFARWSPAEPLVLLAEVDAVYQSLTWNGHRGGYAAALQADYEPLQGVHAVATLEAKNGGAAGEDPSFGATASGLWFFAPHADLRVDLGYQRLPTPAGTVDVASALFQLHTYL